MDERASEQPGLRMTMAHKQIFVVVSDYSRDRSETDGPHKQLLPESEEIEMEELARESRAQGETDL